MLLTAKNGVDKNTYDTRFKKYAVLAPFCIFLFLLILSSHHARPGLPPDPSIYILAAIEKCTAIVKKNECYKETAKKLILLYDTQDIVSVMAANETKPEIFSSCHTILHFLGQEKYKETGDISKALAEGSPVCFAGFYHGVMEEYLVTLQVGSKESQEKTLYRKIGSMCPRDASLSNYQECLHGLGHALMFFTDNDLPHSLDYCDFLAPQDAEWCYSGAFMENSTSVTNSDHPSKYLKVDDPLYPCSTLKERYLHTCYILQGFYFTKITNYDLPKIFSLCRKVPSRYQMECFNSVGQSSVGNSADLAQTRDACMKIPEQHFQTPCIEGALGALTERYPTRQSLTFEFCSELPPEHKQPCYIYARNIIKFRRPDVDMHGLCKELGLKFQDECQNTLNSPKNSSSNNLIPSIFEFRSLPLSSQIKILEGMAEFRSPIALKEFLEDAYPDEPHDRHELGHILGKLLVKKLGLEGFGACPTLFSYGCFHGASLAAAQLKNPETQLGERLWKACEKQTKHPTICLHGLGHALLILKKYDLLAAYSECEKIIPDEKNVFWCLDGVAMENVSRSMAAADVAPYGNTDDPYYPCNTVPKKYEAVCVRNHVEFVQKKFLFGNDRIIAFCLSYKEGGTKLECIRAFGTLLVGIEAQETSRENVCRRAGNYSDVCLDGIVIALGMKKRYSDAAKLCSSFSDVKNSNLCEKRIQSFRELNTIP